MAFFRSATSVINAIEAFFNTVDEGVLVFKEGASNHLHGNQDAYLKYSFNRHSEGDSLEGVENITYLQAIKRVIGMINKPLAN